MNDSRCESPSRPVCALFFLVLATGSLLALFFHSPETALRANDSPPAWFESIHFLLQQGFVSQWSTEYRLGEPYSSVSPDLNSLILRWTSFPFSLDLLFSVNLLIGGTGMFLLLRSLGLSGVACVFGGAAFLLTNGILTLVLPGHVNKVMTCAWLPFSMAAFLLALRDGAPRFYILSGAFLGLGLLGGEVQLSYYLGLWYVVWSVVHLGLRRDAPGGLLKSVPSHAAGLLLVAFCSLVLGMATTLHSLSYLSTAGPVVGSEASEENWRFATQFYFPPEEILSYLTTIQFFGGPHVYWGRDGNPTPLRLSDDYMGLLPFGFAILGGIVCWRIWQARLFIVMGIGSLLISFGREGGLYWLLYQLPTMKSQRNPHRWSYFVSLAVCVLAAYGINWLIHRLAASPNPKPDHQESTEPAMPDWKLGRRILLVFVLAGAGLFALAGVLSLTPQPVAEFFYAPAALASPDAPLFGERTRMLLNSLTRTGCFLALSAGSVWWVIAASSKFKVPSSKLWILAPWIAVILVLILDLGLNARRYIQFYPWKDYYLKNELANFLRQDRDFYRVKAFGVQEQFWLNSLVSNVLPFHRIPVADPPASAQMPRDYARFFNFASEHRVMRSDRYFDLFNVKYVLSLQPFSDAYANFSPVARWNGIYVHRRDDFMPRAWLAEKARVIREGGEAVLFATLHPALDLRKTVVLEEPPQTVPVDDRGPGVHGPVSEPHEGSARPSSPGEVRPPKKILGNKKDKSAEPPPSTAGRSARILRHEDNRIEIETSADQPTLLVLSEKWDAGWKAWLNDQPVKIYKANFLMRAVELPPGKHTVRMEYRPSPIGFRVSAVSISLLVLWGLAGGLRRLRKRIAFSL